MLGMAMVALLVCALLLFSAFFSGSETALVSLSPYRLKKLIIKKRSLAGMFSYWLRSPHYILTALLIGNNVVNIALTTIATALALALLKGVDPRLVEGAVWLGLLPLVLVAGEIAPKIYSRQHPERISLLTIRPLYYLTRALQPLLAGFLWCIKPITRGMSLAPVKNLSLLSVEEIKRLIAESGEQGQLGQASREMMQKVLVLNERAVGQIMTPLDRMEYLDGASLHPMRADALDTLIEIGHTRIPVCQGDPRRITGYINLKDITAPLTNALPDITRLIRQPLFVRRDETVAAVLQKLKQGRTHLAVVHDAEAWACGIVTLEDILEEIVGEIIDEYDVETGRS